MTSWKDQLDQCGIAWRGPPPGRLPGEAELAAAEQRLKTSFPASYRAFAREIGPVRLGDLLEIRVPWNARGFFDTPRDVTSRLSSFTDASGGGRTAFAGKAISLGLLVLGSGPVPRVIGNQCAELFYAPAEPTEPGEWTLYALDPRARAAPPRLVKLARTFTELIVEGFCRRRLARLPFAAAPAPDQFALELHPRALP